MRSIAASSALARARSQAEEAEKRLRELRERHRFMKGLFGWVGFNGAEIAYEREARIAGRSKFNFWKLWNLALEGITSFSTAPLRVATYLGLLTAASAFGFGAWVVHTASTKASVSDPNSKASRMRDPPRSGPQ